jgi:hypothetical protein
MESEIIFRSQSVAFEKILHSDVTSSCKRTKYFDSAYLILNRQGVNYIFSRYLKVNKTGYPTRIVLTLQKR